ncbi:hypothetical protein PoB_001707200, partial [Plakobranchus ocellatus]
AEDVTAIKEVGPNAVQMLVSSVNPHLFWAPMSDDLPKLVALAKPLIISTVNSANAEHSFFIYNLQPNSVP